MKKKDVAKKMIKAKAKAKEHDSLAHLKDEKTGYYNLKLHSGKGSLNRASGRNEGDKMTLGKNENNRF